MNSGQLYFEGFDRNSYCFLPAVTPYADAFGPADLLIGLLSLDLRVAYVALGDMMLGDERDKAILQFNESVRKNFQLSVGCIFIIRLGWKVTIAKPHSLR